MAKSKKPKKSDLQQTEEYVEFLRKALASDNFKQNDPGRYAETKKKYDRAKLKLKFLKDEGR